LCGWQLARAMLVSHAKLKEDERFHSAKIATAEFYAEHILSHAPAIEASIVSANGKLGVLALSEEQF
jgi:3-(methylthio)propanoyl-CoA dehydrogenase